MKTLNKLKNTGIKFHDVIPFIAFFVIFAFFAIMSYDDRTGAIKMLSSYNLNLIIDQSILTIIVGCGTLFVISQGSIDLSVGVNVALSGVVSTWFCHATDMRFPFLLIPISMIVGLIVGSFNGLIVSRYKVPSFLVTLAMLIGVRGLVNYFQTTLHVQRLPEALTFINIPVYKITFFVIIVIIMAYVFEFTNAGRYSRAIGENETAAKFVGIPVNKIKLLAFALSGLMSGVGAVFSLATTGGTSQQMGVFLEIKVLMAIYLGGVLVTGGSTSKFYKLLLGSLSITMIINGLAITGWSDSHISQSVQGLLLLLILVIALYARKRSELAKKETDE